jgi:hypothetical protein
MGLCFLAPYRAHFDVTCLIIWMSVPLWLDTLPSMYVVWLFVLLVLSVASDAQVYTNITSYIFTFNP